MAFGLFAAIRSETNIKTDFPTNQENDTLAHTDLSQILTKNPKKTTLSKKTASNISEVIKFFTIQFRPYLLSTFMKIGTKLRHITYDCSILFNNMSKAKTHTDPSIR